MKVIKSELTSLSTSASELFESEISDAQALKNAIDSFTSSIGTDGQFSGEVYEKIKSEMISYNETLEKRITIAQNLSDAITSAANNMAAAMDKDVFDYETELAALEEQLAAVEASIASYDEDETVPSSLYSQKSSIENEITKLNEKKEELEGLSSAGYSAISAVSISLSSGSSI